MMSIKKQQRILPSDIDIKADIHRVKTLIKEEGIAVDSSLEKVRERYSSILERSCLQKTLKESSLHSIDERALAIIQNEGLEELTDKLSPIV